MKHKVYDVINARIIELLDQGVIPWRRPWKGGRDGSAKNMESGREYSGINRWLLNSLAYEKNYFLTYKQAGALGGNVIKGEKGFPVIYWNWIERKNEKTGEVEEIPFLRYYTVFNVSQCEGIPPEKIPSTPDTPPLDFNPIEQCERIVSDFIDSPPVIHSRVARACYKSISDRVEMPGRDMFRSESMYYATLFHELSHSTGHGSRLARNLDGGCSSKDYAREELIAEFASSYLCGVSGIDKPVIENQAAYIANWRAVLKAEKNYNLLIQAAAAAEKAANYMQEGTPAAAEFVAAA